MEGVEETHSPPPQDDERNREYLIRRAALGNNPTQEEVVEENLDKESEFRVDPLNPTMDENGERDEFETSLNEQGMFIAPTHRGNAICPPIFHACHIPFQLAMLTQCLHNNACRWQLPF